MPLYTTDALILRTYKLGESDRIVVFLTRDRGKKRGVAKNARQSRRRFGGALEPMTCGRVGYLERERRELVRLDYVEPTRSPLSRRTDGEALGYVGYFAELIDEWAQDADPNETLFRLGASMVEAMAAGVPIDPLARYFEYWLLRLQGVYQPDAAIVGRGAGVPRRGAGRRARWRSAQVTVSRRALREIEAAHRTLIAMHLEKDLKSVRVLREMRDEARQSVSWAALANRLMTFQSLILKLSEFWASRGCALQQPLDVEVGAGTMHPGDVSARPRTGALERRLRAAVAAAGRRPLRREPQPLVQAPPVPGHSQAGARRGAAAVSREPRSVRHQPAPARHPLRGGQLGVADARRLGHRLAGDVRRDGDLAVHLLSAGRRPSSCRRSRRS